MSKYRERMGRSLGLEICKKMDTYFPTCYVGKKKQTIFLETSRAY